MTVQTPHKAVMDCYCGDDKHALRVLTDPGKDAVRMRGLFGGETEARATAWVAQIEDSARQQGREEAQVDRCHFSSGLDGNTTCVAHGWYGYREQVRSIRVCPDALHAITGDGGDR